MAPHHPSPCRLEISLILGLLAAGCAAAPAPQPAAPEPVTATETQPSAHETALRDLQATLQEERQAAAELANENAELRRGLADEKAVRASLEERYATLRDELAGAVEEVLRSSAAVRGVGSRAFATSRISEVRVQLQSVAPPQDPEVAARLELALEFLARADQALVEENYGGAAYLAERASGLIRQARIVGEIRASSDRAWGDLIPIVPPRRMTVISNSNLRAGPGVDRERIAGVKRDEMLLAVARSGEWLQIETESGLKAWIHRRLVRQP